MTDNSAFIEKAPKKKRKGLRKTFATVAAVAVVGGGGWLGWSAWEAHEEVYQNDNQSQSQDPPAPPAPADTEPSLIDAFGQTAVRKSQSFDPELPFWNMALRDQELGMQNPQYAQAYREFLAQFDFLRGLPIDEQVRKVNEIVNMETTYMSDDALYGTTEYWAAPIETALNHAGDCEDYALLEMEILRYLGVPENRMFLTAVNAEGNPYRGPDHAILMVNEAPAGEAPQYFLLGDAQPVLPADNEIIGKTWMIPPENIPADFILANARNKEGYWEVRTGVSKPISPNAPKLVAQTKSGPKIG